MWKKIKNIFGNKENQVKQSQVSSSLENDLSLNKTEECELDDKIDESNSFYISSQSQNEDRIIEERPFYLPPSDILGERDYLLPDEEAYFNVLNRAADKVYVVECEKESGTMHAVNFALKYCKPIFALDCDWSGNRYLLENGLAKPLILNKII